MNETIGIIKKNKKENIISKKFNENCKFFIDWLELFQITYTKYLTENYEVYENNKIVTIEIPGIKLLNEINGILMECKWICYSLNVQ